MNVYLIWLVLVNSIKRGAAYGNYFNRYNFRSNIVARPKDWLRMGMNIAFSYDERQRNTNFGNSGKNAAYLMGGLSFLINPMYPAIDPATGKDYAKKYPGTNLTNPKYDMENGPDVYERYGILGNAFFELEPIKDLKIKSRLGTDMYFIRDNWMTKASYEFASQGSRGKSFTYGFTNTITNTLNTHSILTMITTSQYWVDKKVLRQATITSMHSLQVRLTIT